ncbi:hypothetical protein [Microcella sp.]|uniref:hypothetical protein n=1 Tax=Microcella sp. TaxID=1913979 RepID=UPI00299F5CD6|nr:hypothetical protein [Microcella sp.]MDX2024874.1 hypothetical protein [Microcella sp.]
MPGRVLIGAVAIVFVLAGCTPAAEPSTPEASPSVTESPTPTVEPTVEPVVEALTIPECETLVPLALAKAQFSESTESRGEMTATEYPVRFDVPGVTGALVGAETFRACAWAVPNSDGFFALAVASITADTRTSLQAELSAAGFASTTMGTVTAFELEGEGAVSSIGATYLFTGDVLIACNGTSISLTGAITGSALDAMRTANPTLGL